MPARQPAHPLPPLGPLAGVLTIDLGALVANWAYLARTTQADRVGAVVKADAYGLGARVVVPALVRAGCRRFFVAHLAEAAEILDLIPADGWVAVLNGLNPGAESACADLGVRPALNSVGQARRWQAEAERRGTALPALLQFDSGMSRLGVSAQEAQDLAVDSGFAAAVKLEAVMSHLACADDPEAPANTEQLARFRSLAALFPGVPRSFANSPGCLLPPAFHGTIARPGLGLYGANPGSTSPSPFTPVVRLQARVIQTRRVPAGAGVGYGLTWHADAETGLATLAVGYADGWLRSLSGRGAAYWQGIRLPIVGRVSMDSITVSLAALNGDWPQEGDLVDLIGPDCPIETVAAEAGTIPYEILTSLGHRYERVVIGSE